MLDAKLKKEAAIKKNSNDKISGIKGGVAI
jgi:hypothetical protein